MPDNKNIKRDNTKKNDKDKEILKDEELNEDEEEKKPQVRYLETKPIPAIIVLVAGLVAAVDTYLQHCSLKSSLTIIFVTLLVFFIIGEVVKELLDKVEIIIPVEEPEAQEEEKEETEDKSTEDA